MCGETLYRRLDDNKYVPVGTDLDFNCLSDGVWLVHSGRLSKGRTSVEYLTDCYKLDYTPSGLKLACDLESAVQEVLSSSELTNVIRKTFSVEDIVRCAVKTLFEKKY